MNDFNECEPNKMYFNEVKKISKLTKEETILGGRNGMSDLWENALKEERAEGKAEGVQQILANLVKDGILSKEEAEKRISCFN